MLSGMAWRLFAGGADQEGGETGEQAAEAGGGDDEPAPWVVVLTVFEPVQATLATARLRDEGIPARTRQEAASAALPVGLGILGRIDVLVPGSMVEKALAILDDVEALDLDDEATADGFEDEADPGVD